MAAASNRKKSAQLQLVGGNPGKRSTAALKNRAARSAAYQKKVPPVPPHLSVEAKREWKRVTQHLHRMGIITELDRAALASYCAHYGRWVVAEKKLAELSPELWVTILESGYEQKTQWLGIANQAMAAMNKIGQQFGLNPIDRENVPIDLDDHGSPEKSKQDSYFTTSA